MAAAFREGNTELLISQSDLQTWLNKVWRSWKLRLIVNRINKEPTRLSLAVLDSEQPGLERLKLDGTPETVLPSETAQLLLGPRVQMFPPSAIPFSSLEVSDPLTLPKTHAQARIAYPTAGSTVLAGATVACQSDPQFQVSGLPVGQPQSEITHDFTWYFLDGISLKGTSVTRTFLNTTGMPEQQPVVLQVTNKQTEISSTATSSFLVIP
jgi:hypothetical protein